MSRGRISRREILGILGTGVSGTVAGCRNTSSETTPNATPTRTRTDTATVSPEGMSTETGDTSGTLFVSPDGSSDNPGTRDAPLGMIRSALREAHPGDTIHLLPGDYHEELRTIRSGEPGDPITVTGSPDAVWRPRTDDPGIPLEIVHDYIHVTGITMSGLVDDERALESMDVYGNAILRLTPAPTRNSDRYEPTDYLEGLVISPARIGHSRSSFIGATRITDSSIGGFRVIGPAGIHYHPEIPGAVESHVGEIIYLGSSPSDIYNDDYPYPWDDLDRTRNVRIHHIDNSAGYHHSELVDIKIGCENVTVEYCTDRGAGEQTDGAEAGAIALKSNNCKARWNDIGDCPLGIEFDPWAPNEETDVRDWAANNSIYGNHIHDYSKAAITFSEPTTAWQPTPEAQRVFCGNRIDGNDADQYAYATGECPPGIPAPDTIGHLGGDSP